MCAAGVPAIAHRSEEEWAGGRHASESGLVGADGLGRRTLAPLAWWGSARDASRSYADQTLSSVRVLDLCNVIAGPTIGSMLARMGARVTKIDPTVPEYAPDVTVVYGMVANLHKESILLDLASVGGRRAFESLVRTSDVVLVNSTEECARRLGVTAEELARLNPDAILLRFDAWGGPRESGPLANAVGYDDNVQAGIGIMERFGGSLADAEEHAHVGTIDVIAGVAGAFAAAASLLARKREVSCATRARRSRRWGRSFSTRTCSGELSRRSAAACTAPGSTRSTASSAWRTGGSSWPTRSSHVPRSRLRA